MSAYMNYPGLNGNGKGKWAGWIQLETVIFGIKQVEGYKPDVQVLRKVDSISMQLLIEAKSGEARDIEIVMVSGNDAPYMHVELKGAIISSFNVGGSVVGETTYEQFSFSYEKMSISNQARSTPKNAKDAEHAAKAGWAANP